MFDIDLLSLDEIASMLRSKCEDTKCGACDFFRLNSTCALQTLQPYEWDALGVPEYEQFTIQNKIHEPTFTTQPAKEDIIMIQAIEAISLYCKQFKNVGCKNENGTCKWEPLCEKYWAQQPDKWVLPDYEYQETEVAMKVATKTIADAPTQEENCMPTLAELGLQTTHMVFQTSDMKGAIGESTHLLQDCNTLIEHYKVYREQQGKDPNAEYIVINTDEPYAEEVAALIRARIIQAPPELVACPFCGHTKAMSCMDSNKMWDLREGDLNYQTKPRYSVCCDAHKGGCGAHSGFRISKQAAIKSWNNRAQEANR